VPVANHWSKKVGGKDPRTKKKRKKMSRVHLPSVKTQLQRRKTPARRELRSWRRKKDWEGGERFKRIRAKRKCAQMVKGHKAKGEEKARYWVAGK